MSPTPPLPEKAEETIRSGLGVVAGSGAEARRGGTAAFLLDAGLVLAVLLGLGGSLHFGDVAARFGTALACLAAATVSGLWWVRRRWSSAEPAGSGPPIGVGERGVVAGLLLAALLVRVWELERFPIQLHGDEMNCGLESARFVGKSGYPLAGVGWYGHPALGYFLASVFQHAGGVSLFTLRLGSVLFGLIALAFTWALVRDQCGRRVALVTLALGCFYHWHLHFSRSGYHFVLAQALIVGVMFLLFRGTRREDPFLLAVCGALLGVALQAYSSTYFLPLFCVLWTGFLLWREPQRRWQRAGGLTLLVLFSCLTYSPMLRYFARHPERFAERSRQVFLFDARNRGHVVAAAGSERWGVILADQARRTVGFFLGGRDTQHQYKGARFVDEWILVPFFGGLLLTLRRAMHPPAFFHLLWMGLVLVLGGVLTIDPPASPRLFAIGTLIPVFPALFLQRICQWRTERLWRVGMAALTIGLVLVVTWRNLGYTFVEYPRLMPGQARDAIVRVAEREGPVAAIVTILPDAEDFRNEAYLFVARGPVGRSWPPLPDSGERVRKDLRTLPRPLLLILPPQGFDLPVEVRHELAMAKSGRVAMTQTQRGFLWFLLR